MGTVLLIETPQVFKRAKHSPQRHNKNINYNCSGPLWYSSYFKSKIFGRLHHNKSWKQINAKGPTLKELKNFPSSCTRLLENFSWGGFNDEMAPGMECFWLEKQTLLS